MRRAQLCVLLLLIGVSSLVMGLPPQEVQLSSENAYNPTPSPDGKAIVAVRVDWGRPGSGGVGRSNLQSDLIVMDRAGHVLSPNPLAEDKFVAEWGKDGIVAFRDWSYALIAGNGKVRQQGRVCREELVGTPLNFCEERVAYLRTLRSFVWLRQEWAKGTLITPRGQLSVPNSDGYTGELLAPSPSERYVAAGPGLLGKTVRIYDLAENRWFDLGPGILHPDDWWPREVPGWNPWFPDSSQLAFFSTEGLVIVSPNGANRRVIARPQQPAGLAVPSPDGNFIAYATFASHPNGTGHSPTWRCTGIWLVSVRQTSVPKRLTSGSARSTVNLHWLDSDHLLFDRVEWGMPPKARIWMVPTGSR